MRLTEYIAKGLHGSVSSSGRRGRKEIEMGVEPSRNDA
jgi:hypothetical protein